jgi:hypothetical protein
MGVVHGRSTATPVAGDGQVSVGARLRQLTSGVHHQLSSEEK